MVHNSMKIKLFLLCCYGWCLLLYQSRLSRNYLLILGVFDSKQAERIILVTYADKHIDRIPIGVANQLYRRRGDYNSSNLE